MNPWTTYENTIRTAFASLDQPVYRDSNRFHDVSLVDLCYNRTTNFKTKGESWIRRLARNVESSSLQS